MFNTIEDPLTNKKINITSKKGRKILNNYIKHVNQNGGLIFKDNITFTDHDTNTTPVCLINDVTDPTVGTHGWMTEETLRNLLRNQQDLSPFPHHPVDRSLFSDELWPEHWIPLMEDAATNRLRVGNAVRILEGDGKGKTTNILNVENNFSQPSRYQLELHRYATVKPWYPQEHVQGVVPFHQIIRRPAEEQGQSFRDRDNIRINTDLIIENAKQKAIRHFTHTERNAQEEPIINYDEDGIIISTQPPPQPPQQQPPQPPPQSPQQQPPQPPPQQPPQPPPQPPIQGFGFGLTPHQQPPQPPPQPPVQGFGFRQPPHQQPPQPPVQGFGFRQPPPQQPPQPQHYRPQSTRRDGMTDAVIARYKDISKRYWIHLRKGILNFQRNPFDIMFQERNNILGEAMVHALGEGAGALLVTNVLRDGRSIINEIRQIADLHPLDRISFFTIKRNPTNNILVNNEPGVFSQDLTTFVLEPKSPAFMPPGTAYIHRPGDRIFNDWVNKRNFGAFPNPSDVRLQDWS